MDENKLNEEEMSAVSGGLSVGESLDYALEQGKKVLTIVTDTLEKLTARE